jgi:transcriptional regulator with XRE-family HTH domain
LILSEQIKAARSLVGWDQTELAARAGVGITTVKRLEARPGVLGGTMATAVRLKAALEAAGVEFIGGPDDGPGVRLWKK